jgi:hypothetical protein
MPIFTLNEDELHPRIQVREYARHLQSAYGGLLEKALPGSLTALLGRLETQAARQAGHEGEKSA